MQFCTFAAALIPREGTHPNGAEWVPGEPEQSNRWRGVCAALLPGGHKFHAIRCRNRG
jgi:hypothetical protein